MLVLNNIEEDWAQLDRAAMEVIETTWYARNETELLPAIVSSGKLGLPLTVTFAVPLDVNPKKLVKVKVMMYVVLPNRLDGTEMGFCISNMDDR